MSARLRLLLLIPHLGGGGAEQVTALLAQHLDPGLFEIHLGLLTPDQPGARRPPEWVVVHRLEAPRVRRGAWALWRLIWAIKPDLVLSNMVHLNLLVLLLKPLLPWRTRVAVRQNTTASAGSESGWRWLGYCVLYRRADAVICQSEAMAKDFRTRFGLVRSKVAVLANPVDAVGIERRLARLYRNAPGQDAEVTRQSPYLLAVGRLSHEKGIDLLLRALVLVRERIPGVGLMVVGDGPERASLRALAKELELTKNVRFAGHREHPSDFYTGSTLFVQPSRWEGIPNALLEAAAGGLPIVATPSSLGVVELLEGQPHTWLAAEVSVEALATAILTALAEVMEAEYLPDGRPPRFKHGFLEPFVLKTAIGNYQRLLLEVGRGRRS
jgi:glycosyltransferase involved in cell wall biosynthesis